MSTSMRHLRFPFTIAFIIAATALLAPLMGGAEEPPASSSPRKAVDDEGKEFAIPADWPADLPLPQIKNNCVRCHIDKGGALSQSVYDFAGSTHDHEMLACDTCHGGNTKDDDKAHEGNFISGALSKLMDKCADCHKTEAKIFNKSAHFSPKIKWDHPICSTCHDNHSVGKGHLSLAGACTSCHGAKAQARSGEGESEIVWKSRIEGAAGNNISVELLADSPNQKLELVWSKPETSKEKSGVAQPPSAVHSIRITLATDSSGKPISTAEEVLDLVKADKELYYILEAQEGGDSLGEGVVAPAKLSLSGGAGFEAKHPAYAEMIAANDALWESLQPLRKDRDKTPEKLDDSIAALRKDAMALIHESAAAPDPAKAKSVADRSAALKQEIEEVLAKAK